MKAEKTYTDMEWFNKTDVSEENYTEELQQRIRTIGEWYDAQVSVVSEKTTAQWNLLAVESEYQAKRLTRKYNVKVDMVEGQPYLTPNEMFADIGKGLLKISIDNAIHPIHSLMDTVYLRIWHDMTHWECKANFGFSGEVKAYQAQVQHTKEFSVRDRATIEHTLYVDIVGQVANGLIHSAFPIQKVF